MKITVFDTKPHDRQYLEKENEAYGYELKFLESRLTPDTARLAAGSDAVCAFVNDDIGAATIDVLVEAGVKLIAMRCAGFNNVDMRHAYGKIHVVRVPKYSPYAIAEHAMALLLTLNRKTHRAYIRTRDHNFSLTGLLGFDLHGKTVGVVGTGQIGRCFINICRGFGMHVLAYDPYPVPNADYEYVDLETLLRHSDVISLHCPLTAETNHLLNSETMKLLKPGVVILNTSRGALIDSQALIEALKSSRVGGAALDVYEEESEVFFEDWSDQVIQDDQLVRLISFNNVIITSHQAFFTREALAKIAEVTFLNLKQFNAHEALENEICYRCPEYGKGCHKEKGKPCFVIRN
ncbi:MAG: 2-hydroxyacid dehydrogenase [Proteobacteria bacterium]|nr:2-hydroxyacid dehydrogenase [Pseudomonadota bacterium]